MQVKQSKPLSCPLDNYLNKHYEEMRLKRKVSVIQTQKYHQEWLEWMQLLCDMRKKRHKWEKILRKRIQQRCKQKRVFDSGIPKSPQMKKLHHDQENDYDTDDDGTTYI